MIELVNSPPKMSTFTPTDKSLYEVLFSLSYKEKVSSSPVNQKKPRTSKKNVRKTKKRWDNKLKAEAVKKADELGLTHATIFLQKMQPEHFAKLCPSTLQYWVRQCDHQRTTFGFLDA
ncbi:hypothetical protein EIN_162510 [Entamoeba invadens IP1]|uniref:Uncharacterized protein n=1 Tax=Entamoeba invadens IP1 TaxID=370355 RepID=A0A0A1U1V9_ENTIV|nr:hypothetical protein EIN_162510 [Entamoeba invadens IP1]ELP86607.1 hypothetical protein EIN_162510 [Entamoeba invadens IP1]|eukprot:XP_004185953.1 hypothetical protein EIN_162510 [Entamoeba invadens IP1]